MNISELSRKLKTTPEELLEKLPELGFDIGMRALKVDDRIAQNIVEKWNEYKKLEKEREKWSHVKTKGEETVKQEIKAEKEVKLPSRITVREFANRLGMAATRVIKELMNNGILASLNDFIDFETASIIAEDLGFKASQHEEAGEDEEILFDIKASDGKDLTDRPPVIVVMGHVDHGKTSLLDKIRETSVVAGEAGGITQHIGAYQTEKQGKRITFIDTPGHEAFTAMRSRGARVADVAILIVAADDGVQPQTREAFKIIQAAKLPMVVAINKIDRPEINLDKIKGELSELGITPEDWGGKTVMVPISAKTGENIDTLLDSVLLVVEVEKENLKASAGRKAIGTVIESHVDPKEGISVTVLVQNGTLRIGDFIAHGKLLLGRVRTMRDWNGKMVREAAPSSPVKILGLKALPDIGDMVFVPETIEDLERKKKLIKKASHIAPITTVKTEQGDKIILNIILRADVLGSLEAILSSLEKIEHEKLGVKVIAHGLGNITENDVRRAESENAAIFGFHVLAKPEAEDLARSKEIGIKIFEVIYDLIDAVKLDIEKLAPEEVLITYAGKLKVKEIFRTEKNSQIVGGAVIDGKIHLGLKVRILRDAKHIGEASVAELKTGKQVLKEVPAGSECGVRLLTKTKVQPDDELEFFEEKKIRLDVKL